MTFDQINLQKKGEKKVRDQEAYEDQFKNRDVSDFLRTHGQFPGDYPNGMNIAQRKPNRSPSPGCGIQS